MTTPAETAQTMLTAYLEAEVAILQGKSVRMGDRQLTREDLASVISGRKEWEARLSRLQGAGGALKAADFRTCRNDTDSFRTAD